MTMLEITDFGKRFTIHHLGKTMPATEHINFSLEAGEFIGIVGKSGSGKSTILKSIYRSYLPDTGKILYDSAAFWTGGFGNDLRKRDVVFTQI